MVEFFLISNAFGVVSNKSLTKGPKDFSLMCSSRCFIAAGFIVRSLVYFELIFICSVKYGLQFFFFFFFCTQISNCFSTICWKDYLFPKELPWHFCQKPTDHMCVGPFLDSLCYTYDLWLSFLQYHTKLLFTVLKSGSVNILTVLFQSSFCYFISFAFPYKF